MACFVGPQRVVKVVLGTSKIGRGYHGTTLAFDHREDNAVAPEANGSSTTGNSQ